MSEPDMNARTAAALRACVPLLRDELESMIACETRGPASDPFPIDDPSARAMIEPVLAAVREAEACVGRPADGLPQWLNDVIDGRRAW